MEEGRQDKVFENAGEGGGGGLPAFFAPLLEEQYGAAGAARVLAGCAAKRAVSLRANTLRATRDEVATALDAAGIAHETVPWYADAFVLPDVRERAVWDLPLYAQGKVYLQSLSSMLPALVLGAQPGEDVLDMCAAPGGKTSQIAALAKGGAHLTACEMHAPRAEKLQHNLDKLGVRNVALLRTDARRLDDFFRFDRILLDAPCSGSGTLRTGDPKTAKRFTSALVAKCQKQQRALLVRALTLLKPGGTLVYATCSVLRGENEAAVEDALAQVARRRAGRFELQSCAETFPEGTLDALPLLPATLEGALCLAPDARYEGFFMAKVARTA